MARTVCRVARRGSIFYFRVAVPRRLADRMGRELKLSLRTSDASLARALAQRFSGVADLVFRELSRMAPSATDCMRERLREYFQACLNKSLELSMDLPVDPAIDVSSEIDGLLQEMKTLRVKLAAQTFSAAVRREARDLLAEASVSKTVDLDLLQQACSGILRAQIENRRILAAMLKGNFDEIAPRDPLFAGMEPTGLPVAERRTTCANQEDLA